MATKFDPLIGRTIKQIFRDTDAYNLVFRLADGDDHVFSAQGDCCNDVWFNHVSLPVNDGIEGCVVLFVEEKDWHEVEATRQCCEEAAFWTLMTTYGYIDIEVRNSHNGYYGGMVYHSVNEEIPDLTEITEDF